MKNFKNHDPESSAAAYLAGAMSSKGHLAFEEHLLECEDCWNEVDLARAGRGFAESARELAPATLRDDVRAAVSLSAPARHHRGPAIFLAAAAMALTLIVAGFAVGHLSRQPEPVQAAAESFRAGVLPGQAPAAAEAPDLSGAGLQLERSTHGPLAGISVDSFVYRTSSGQRLMVFLAPGEFPAPASVGAGGTTMTGWQVTRNGVVLVCPSSDPRYLVASSDQTLAQEAASVIA